MSTSISLRARSPSLCQQHGELAEGRELLAEIDGWFTEGCDTPDLVDAKTLLQELG